MNQVTGFRGAMLYTMQSLTASDGKRAMNCITTTPWLLFRAANETRRIRSTFVLVARRVQAAVANRWLGALVCAAFALWSVEAAAEWSKAASMSTPRAGHTATLLASGKVLVAGGSASSAYPALSLTSAEVFDPSGNAWTLSAPMATRRSGHSATLLADGMVLVAGGAMGGGPYYAHNSELYNPGSNTWVTIGGFHTERAGHSATRLRNGKVLAVGGLTPVSHFSSAPLKSAELYDPATQSWSTVASMAVARSNHSATLLDDGRVLVIGGEDGAAEVYDPDRNTWTAAASSPISTGGHTATVLRNGHVVVVGSSADSVASYDPENNVWSLLSNMNIRLPGHAAMLLGDGTILAAGGIAGGAALYDPASNTWTRIGNMAEGRYWHEAVLLRNGGVLLVGGSDDKSYLSSAELYSIKGNGTLPVYRFFNLNAGGHFYTLDEAEKNVVVQNYNWFRSEDVGFYAFSGQLPGSLPVYRFFNLNAGGHFYTINEEERNIVLANYGWFRPEKVGFYAYPTPMPGTLPVYRFFNTSSGGHFYTISEAEKDAVIQNYKWFRYEGVGFYAYLSRN
jgi:N-acetylneuraminic acid mutarotase